MSDGDRTQDDEMAFRARLGVRLREARRRNARTLQNVADHFSIAKATVGHWETGTNPIDIGRLFRLARYYGMTVGELVADPLTREEATTLLARTILSGSASAQQAHIDASDRARRGVADDPHDDHKPRFGAAPGDSKLGGLDEASEKRRRPL